LEEDDSGDMPLISALAARRGFAGQRARSRSDDNRTVVLSGEVVTGADGAFAGFRGSVEADGRGEASPVPARTEAFDQALDEILRSPLDRIIENAEQIMARSEGPLRSDYATYGADIAGAARHLLSVLRSMHGEIGDAQQRIDLAALAAEAVVLVEAQAEARSVTIVPKGEGPLPASGEQRGVVQILVNLLSNAIRHSPEGGQIELEFRASDAGASVTVSDQGPGIAAADQERIFERFESAHPEKSGSGLGLAISRRLARSMGGDVILDSAEGQGARFTLTLPVS
jgi:signal transduction histidine kinase